MQVVIGFVTLPAYESAKALAGFRSPVVEWFSFITMTEMILDRFRKYRPRSALVRQAQIELLLHHTKFQTVLAPAFAVFIALAFADIRNSTPAQLWLVGILATYGLRFLTAFLILRLTAASSDRRITHYLVGLAASGIFWAVAPLVLAPEGSDEQLLVAVFAGVALLVGLVGNFLFYMTALVYTVTWIAPTLVSLGIVYETHFPQLAWTYAGVAFVFLAYAYKCLQVITLPLGETLELNEALTDQKERAVASDRAKSDFLAMMSHELRTPLNAIMGYSEIIRDQVFGPDGGKRNVEHAGRIREAAGLLTDLINDLLELSALQANGRNLQIENVDLGDIVALSVELLKDNADKKGIVILSEIPPDLPPIAMDRRAGIQCLTNILGNAVKYASDDTGILIAARVSERFLEIDVRDTGPGIPASEMQQVIEPFNRGVSAVEARVQGVGLGLSIAQNLMTRHGGSLKVASEVNVGTTVTLAFPLGNKANKEIAAAGQDE